jgi:outer membrane protein assembly factor BamE (lipoprotein component of BamABCDE complex)
MTMLTQRLAITTALCLTATIATFAIASTSALAATSPVKVANPNTNQLPTTQNAAGTTSGNVINAAPVTQTREGKAKNRRVEIEVVGTRNK